MTAAGRVVQSRHDRQVLALSKVHLRDQRLDFRGAHHPAVDPQQPVELSPLPQADHRCVGVAQVQAAHLGKEQVVAQLPRETLIHFEAFAEEGDSLRGDVVGPENSRRPGAAAAAHVAPVENGDVAHPALRQVVGGGQSMHARSDDDDVIAALQGVTPPHLLLAEEAQHQAPPERRRRMASTPTGITSSGCPVSRSVSQRYTA